MYKKKIIPMLLGFMLVPTITNAGSASLNCSSSGQVSVGSTISVTLSGRASADNAVWTGKLNYDSSKLRLVSGETTPWGEGASFSKSYTFKGIAPGSAYVKLSDLDVSVDYETALSGSSGACSITVREASSGGGSSNQGTSSNNNNSSANENSNKSSNNKLSSLSIEGASLSPKFSKDTLTYSATVENSTTSVVINASKDDSKATLYGTGTKELVEGTNKFNITVTAENGSSRTYSILITRSEADPIKVKVGKIEYTVLTKLPDEFKIPDGLKEGTTKVEGKSVLALKNEDETLTLVLLREEGKEPKLFVYDEDKLTFIPYNLLKNKNLTLVVLDVEKKLSDYTIKEIKINDEKVKVLVSDFNDDFILVNALNVDNGKKDYYIYNKDSESYILFDKKIYMPYIKNNKNEKLGLITALKRSGGIPYFVSLVAATSLFMILSMTLLVKNKKLKKALVTGDTNVEDVSNDDDDNIFSKDNNTLTQIDQEELNKKYTKYIEKEDLDASGESFDFDKTDLSTGTYDALSKIIDSGLEDNEEKDDFLIDDLDKTRERKMRLKKKKRK